MEQTSGDRLILVPPGTSQEPLGLEWLYNLHQWSGLSPVYLFRSTTNRKREREYPCYT